MHSKTSRPRLGCTSKRLKYLGTKSPALSEKEQELDLAK